MKQKNKFTKKLQETIFSAGYNFDLPGFSINNKDLISEVDAPRVGLHSNMNRQLEIDTK